VTKAAPAFLADALARDFPAVRQLAQSHLLADRTMDGVTFAYGTHHVLVPDRLTALIEAHQIPRPGGPRAGPGLRRDLTDQRRGNWTR
jgi:hypothetical protein